MPVVVGFGVKTGAHAAARLREGADGVVVGSALVEAVRASLDDDGRATSRTVDAVTTLVKDLARGRALRRQAEGGRKKAVACAALRRRGKIGSDDELDLRSRSPKIKTLFKRESPDNLWIKCPDTGQVVFHKDVEANQWVIPGSEPPHAHLARPSASS